MESSAMALLESRPAPFRGAHPRDRGLSGIPGRTVSGRKLPLSRRILVILSYALLTD
jgi:hypothetical protein